MARNLKRSIYEEEQDQYEERNQLFLNQKNADGKFYQTMQNRKFMFYGMGVIAVLCLFGIMKHFVDIVDPKANQQPTTVAQQQIPQAPTPQQLEADREKEEQRIANEENERELKNLQNSFNPFEGNKYGTATDSRIDQPNAPQHTADVAHPVEPIMHNGATAPINHDAPFLHDQEIERRAQDIHMEDPHAQNSATIDQGSYQSATKKHNAQEPRTDMHGNVNPPHGDIHTNDAHSHTDSVQTDNQSVEKEAYELKGFANDGGITYCYVSVNGSTMRVTEGDRVGTKTVQRIGQNFIVIEDEDGTQEMLSM